MTPIFDRFFKDTTFKILVSYHKNEKYFCKIQKKCQKMPFFLKNWPKSLIKVWKFGSTIHTFEKSTIRNRIHYIKFILVLVIWKNPLTRVFPLFVIIFGVKGQISLRFLENWREVARYRASCCVSSGVSNHDTNFWSIFERYQIQNSCLIPQKWKILLPKFRKMPKKCHFPQKIDQNH